jgi:hypothetical protein
MQIAIALLLLLAGCASTQRRDYAQRNVQACEYQLALARAAQDPRAPKIAADCEWWRAELAVQSEQSDRDHARAAVIAGGLGNGFQAAGSVPTRAPVNCTSMTVGNVTSTNCN